MTPTAAGRIVWLIFLLPCTAAFSQSYNPIVDILHYSYSLDLNDHDDNITGKAEITLLIREKTNAIPLDLTQKNSEGKGMTVTAVEEVLPEGEQSLAFIHEKERLLLRSNVKPGEQHTYRIFYHGIPADGLIISNNKFGRRGFFGDNWPNRAHNWLPCVDDPSDKATVDYFITAPDHYTVVANGALQEEKILDNHRKQTHWKESIPLSPKIMVIGAADFAVDHPGDVLGVPVYNYVYTENKDLGFKSYAWPLQILPFYITHIGPYPFEKCGNVQSKTRFGGLENAGAIFYFENSVTDPGIESLMAHEIAHQWFGDAVTETTWEHLWLSEGFATYLTECYLENRYGPDILRQHLRAEREKVFEFEKKRGTPILDTSVKNDYMQLLNPNNYEKGGWVLHMLRRKIGDSLFWKGISNYYSTYRNKNASTADFEKIMEEAGGQDLGAFFHQWLELPGHPHVTLTWSYDLPHKQLTITIKQTVPAGQPPFSFPLEYTVDGAPYHIDIHDANTKVRLTLRKKPVHVEPDPHVSLLADFKTIELKP